MHMLRFLGEVSVGLPPGAARRQLSRSRSISVLACLAASDRGGVTRDRLVALLWEDTDRERARHSLSNQLHILRKALGAEAILTPGDFVRLNPDLVSADVAQFKTALQAGDLERAAGLYGGPFLDGFHLDGSGEFERWVDDERHVLAVQALEVFESLAARGESDRDPESVLKWLQRAAQHDPYNSRTAVALAQALAAARDPGNAVQLLIEHVQKLREDLGIEPDEEILNLIETGDFGVRAGTASRLTAGSPSVEATTVSSPALAPDVPRHRSAAHRIAILVTLLVAIAATGAVVSHVRGRQFDPGLIAVLPIRPVGVESQVAALVTTQLHASLAEWETLRAGQPEETQAWWSRYGGSPEDALPADIGPRIGTELGAGKVLIGNVSSAGDGFLVSASLLAVPGGEILASARASGPLDSLPIVSDMLITRLVAEELGLPADRIATLETQDPTAVRLFLEAHPHDSEMRDRLLREVLARDSTFALAALELHESLPDYYGLDLGEVWEGEASIAWRYRDRLSPADRAYVEALLGWRFNELHSARQQVEAWSRAVEVAPDRVNHWRGLFLECYRWCAEVWIDWQERALEAHDSLMARGDTAFLERGLEVALLANDVQRMQSYSRLLPPDAWYGRWLTALGLGSRKEQSALRQLASNADEWNHRFGNAAILSGLGLDEAETANAEQVPDRPGEIFNVIPRLVLARERGRHGEYRSLMEKIYQGFLTRASLDALLAANVIVEWAYFGEPESDETLARLDSSLGAIIERAPVVSADTLSIAHCYRAQLRLARRDTTGLAAAVEYLSGNAEARLLALSRICVPLLGLLEAEGQDRNSHWEAARNLNETMRSRPLDLGIGPGLLNAEAMLAAAANIELARSFRVLGYPEAGLEAAGRRPYRASYWPIIGFHADFLREEARLLAQAGEADAAVSRYEKYFRLRPQRPDLDSWAEAWEAARNELAELTDPTSS